MHISIYIIIIFKKKKKNKTCILHISVNSSPILSVDSHMSHICARRVKMQKHSSGPQSPVRREGGRERHNQNMKVGHNRVILKNKTKVKEKGWGGEHREKEQTQGVLFQSRHKNVSVSKSLSCKNSRAFEERKKKKVTN